MCATYSLRKKLEKIPVPPTGNSKDARLNREFLLEKNASAEAALEPTLREIAELETELEKEKELLRQDVQHLEKLKKNAKAQEQVRAEKSRLVCIVFLYEIQNSDALELIVGQRRCRDLFEQIKTHHLPRISIYQTTSTTSRHHTNLKMIGMFAYLLSSLKSISRQCTAMQAF